MAGSVIHQPAPGQAGQPNRNDFDHKILNLEQVVVFLQADSSNLKIGV